MRKNTNKREDFNTNKFDCTKIQKVSENWVIQNNPFLYFSSCCNPFFLKKQNNNNLDKTNKTIRFINKNFYTSRFFRFKRKKNQQKNFKFFFKKTRVFFYSHIQIM